MNAAPYSLGIASKDFSVDNMKKTGFYGYVYGFSVNYGSIHVDHIFGIHKYLLKKHNINNIWIYLKKCLLD